MKVATSLLAVLLVAAAVACSDDDESAESADTAQSTPSTQTSVPTDPGAEADPTTTAVADDTSTNPSTSTSGAPASVIAAGRAYVALGSSIASGFGISVQSTDCGRSNRSYPNLVAARLDLALSDVTCGGATVRNVVDTAQGDHPPQTQALTSDTALVTVTVGGNDIGYNGTALACSDPSSECTPPTDLDARLDAVGPALVAMIDAIRTAAPEAVVVLVTYPREIPDTNCPDLSLTDTELAVLADMGTRLQDVFVEVAEQTGVVLVDPYVEPADHTGCAPVEERWVAGAVADDGFAFHPTALGHEVMAEMIIDALAG